MGAEGPSSPVLMARLVEGVTLCTIGRRAKGAPSCRVMAALTMPSVPGPQLQTLCLGARPALPPGRGKSWILKQNDPDHKSSHPLLSF